MDDDRKPSRGRPKGRGRLPVEIGARPTEEAASGESETADPVVEAPVAPEDVVVAPSESMGDVRISSRGLGRLPAPYLVTRPSRDGFNKQGTSGTPVDLAANYFMLQKKPTFKLYQYRVDMEPDFEESRIRKSILKEHRETLPLHIFDGTIMFCQELLTADPMTLMGKDKSEQPVSINIRLTKCLEPEDPGFIQFQNIILRSVMNGLELDLLGRHFYDSKMSIPKPNWKIELWPGFMTSLRTCDGNVSLLNVEVTHKMIRTETVFDIINMIRQRGGTNEEMELAVVGRIVMTKYNRNKTYKVDGIAWGTTASSTFQTSKGEVTFLDYFKNRYQQEIRNARQPMLRSEIKKRDVHGGRTKMTALLVPELCYITGLDDEQRANFSLMRDLSDHLHMAPGKRMNSVTSFIHRIMSCEKVKTDLLNWNVRFQEETIKLKGRTLPSEKMVFKKNGQPIEIPANAEWSKSFRDCQMISTIPLDRWILIVPARNVEGLENLVRTLMKVATPLNFRLAQPKITKLPNPNAEGYRNAIRDTMTDDVQMYFVILPHNRLELYSAVKQCISIEYGIPSQCYLAKNINNKGLMSVATKVAIQMNAKLGGEPWSVPNPLNDLMVIGFDVYHGAAGGDSIGAMVATLNKNLSRYYSTVSKFEGKREIFEKIGISVAKCVREYKNCNKIFPSRIMFYRDGVGEGDLDEVYKTELKQILIQLKEQYGETLPKFTFIVVSKRINTRFFARQGSNIISPVPGTIVDSVVTLPERYDFFLISQSVRQGTVSPCSYNVLHDSSGLPADKIQIFTFKLCHMYYNWSGTVGVPSPCQYSHKLAYLTGLSLKRPANSKLQYLLHFL